MIDFDAYGGQLAVNFAMTGIVVIGFYITFMSGQLSMAHQMFMGVGAYAAGYASTALGWGLWQTLPLSVLLAAAAGALTGVLTMRFSGMHLAVATLALAEAVVVVLNNTPILGGIEGMAGIPLNTTGELAILAFLVVVLLTALLERTSLSLWFRSTGDDELAARSVGVRVITTRIAAFTLGAAVAGLGGSLYAQYYGFVEPMTFGLTLGISLLLAMKLGGAGFVGGPILGTAVVVGLPEVLRPFGIDQEVAFGLILILVVIVRPDGIVGKRGELANVWRRLRGTRRTREQPAPRVSGEPLQEVDR